MVMVRILTIADLRLYAISMPFRSSKKPVCCTVDLETAEEKLGSICEIGVVWFDEAGIPIDEYGELVSLPEGFSFDPDFVKFHGITAEDVAGCRSMGEIMNDLAPKLEGLPILAHNSDFEQSHLDALEQFYPGVRVPDRSQYVDTLRLSRYFEWEEAGHKLSDVCERYGVAYDTGRAHRALYDSQVLGAWFFEFVARHYNNSIEYALAKYFDMEEHVGSYEWWKTKRGQMPPSSKQEKFVLNLLRDVRLSVDEVSSAATREQYSMLIEIGLEREKTGIWDIQYEQIASV